MKTVRLEPFIFILVIGLLISQVGISTLLVNKIDDLTKTVVSNTDKQNKTISSLIQPNSGASNAPDFIEDVSTDDDPTLGTENAPVVIVGFSDFQCPYCAKAKAIIENLLNEFEGQILYVHRDFPIQGSHPFASTAAEAAECAGEQNKYWDMYDLIFANQTALSIENLQSYARQVNLDIEQFTSCLEDGRFAVEVEKDRQAGLAYSVYATPTFFVNGHRVVGASEEQLRQAVETVLSEIQ